MAWRLRNTDLEGISFAAKRDLFLLHYRYYVTYNQLWQPYVIQHRMSKGE